MKIAYIIPSLINQGMVTVVYDLVKMMVAHNHDCIVYFFDEKPDSYIFPCPTIKLSFSDKINFNDYDVIHSHGLRPDLYVSISKPINCSAKVITTSHNFVFEDLISDHGEVLGFIGGICWVCSWKRFDKVVVLTKSAYNYYKRFVSESRMAVIGNSRLVDLNLQIEDKDVLFFKQFRNEGLKIIGSICRITKRKGLEDVIYSLKYLEGFVYVVVGDGPDLAFYKKLSESLGVSDKVYFLGSRPAGYRYNHVFDVVCIPSRSEGFPLSMLEAAQYKKAVVTSDFPIFGEIFHSEVIICDSKNPKTLSQAIIKAYEERELLGAAVFDKFCKNYSLKAFYTKYLDVYIQ